MPEPNQVCLNNKQQKYIPKDSSELKQATGLLTA